MRVVVLRHESMDLPSLHRIDALLGQFSQFKATHDMAALAQPDQFPLQVFGELVCGLLRCWRGETETTRNVLQTTRHWLDTRGVAPWMTSFAALVACELALATRDWPSAEQHAHCIVELADSSGYDQGALLGHTLLCHVFEMQGQHVRALSELKAKAARERRIRSDSLATRHEVVAWQLDMRRSEQSRRDLQASAVHLQKLSHEDPLTGIANRRCFETEARAALSGALGTGHGICLALLDVDRFKQVNDQYSHVVGDKVLQVVAALLTEHVRQEDLAARYAGDEFVILFRNIELRTAEDICERLRSAVSRYGWENLAPGLSVSVSVGVAQSSSGDGLESLLQRSDQLMYERKKAAQRMA